MASGIRVLVLSTLFPSRPGDKQGNFILDQARALASQGALVTVVVARPWHPVPALAPENKRKIDPSQYAAENFRVENASFLTLPRFALGERAYHYAQKGILPALERLGGFDVVHAHGFLMGHVAVQYATRRKIPSVVTIHGVETHPKLDDTEGKRKRIGEVLERADRVVLVGSPLVAHCARYSKTTGNLVVIGNGFAVEPDVVPSTRIPRRRPLRVAAVSNYEESKGFDLLVQAIADGDVRGKVEAVLVGGGHGFLKLRKRVRELRLTDSVHFTGLVSHREALAEIMACDVFCLPSWREAYGIMYAEAMALGKFTMGCNGQGPSDFIRHLETGYLMEAGSTSAVVEGLRWVLDHSQKSLVIAAAGQAFARQNLTWDANASKLIELYREVASVGFQQSQRRTTA